MTTQFNPQFKFEKQIAKESYFVYNTKPEEILMLAIQQQMAFRKFRSFNSYLKDRGVKRIQYTSISIKEIANLLKISTREADSIAVQWMNEIGGQVTYCADIAAYYLKGVYEIIN